VPSLVQRVVSGETVDEQRKFSAKWACSISAKWACSDAECESCIKKLKELCLKDCPALPSKERAAAAVFADYVNVRPAMAAQVHPSFSAQSHVEQPESQIFRQAAGERTLEYCYRCTYSNPVGQKCICWVCSNCGKCSRGNTCPRCSTPKFSPLCRICQNKADESGLCKSCTARNGPQQPKGYFCLQCNSINCTGAHQ